MKQNEVLSAFATQFVRPEFRERFIHESTKKPEKLLQRVCHNIDELFSPSLVKPNLSVKKSGGCLSLHGPRGFIETNWESASQIIGSGDGCLIIDASGNMFYAETEAVKGGPSVVYSSGI